MPLPSDRAARWCFCASRAPSPIVGKSKAAMLNENKWAVGAIRIAFLDGDKALQKRVREAAARWTTEAGGPAELRFIYTTDPAKADVRITFSTGGSWSVLGNGVLDPYYKNRPTMQFGWLTPESTDTDIRSVVLHEFGHMIGLVHEHLGPHAAKLIRWDKPAVYADLSGEPNNWDKATIDNNLFDAFTARETTASPKFDDQSIMTYVIPKHWTVDGYSVGLNTDLSIEDERFVKQAYGS